MVMDHLVMKLKQAIIFIVAIGLSGCWSQAPIARAAGFDENSFINVAKKLQPSVVNISTTTTLKAPMFGPPGSPDDLFRRFFDDFMRRQGQGGAPNDRDEEDDEDRGDGPPMRQGRPPFRAPKAMSLGTGFIIDESGLIMTNNHVVADADEISIFFTEDTNEKPTKAEVVGRDPEIDLALIRVKTNHKLTPVVLGDSDKLQVGEMVVAIGNPFGQGHSVSHGIISAKDRIAPDFALARYIQTDAPINPGNSGGPLVNLRGEVIGINNAIDQRAQGIGFAIPINTVKSALPQLKTKGSVSRGYIGVNVEPLTPDVSKTMGIEGDLIAPMVTHVYPGEPADKAGVKPYDLIVVFDSMKIKTPSDLILAVTKVPVGNVVSMTILRGKKRIDLKIKVAERPGPQKPQRPDEKSKKQKPSHIKPSVDPGMRLEEVTPEVLKELGIQKKITGVLVTGVNYGGPADRSGLMRGDIILEIEQKPVPSVDALYRTLKEKRSYLLRVLRVDPRGGENFTIIPLDLKD